MTQILFPDEQQTRAVVSACTVISVDMELALSEKNSRGSLCIGYEIPSLYLQLSLQSASYKD